MQQALQDLGLMVNARADVGLVLDTLLKGLHRGAGLERVMLTVLADGQSRFRAKRVIGEKAQQWLEDFVLPAEQAEQPHIFSYALRHREAIWMGVPASYNLAENLTVSLNINNLFDEIGLTEAEEGSVPANGIIRARTINGRNASLGLAYRF